VFLVAFHILDPYSSTERRQMLIFLF